MTRTRRRHPWYPNAPLGKDRWRKVAPDKTCKPGCALCHFDKLFPGARRSRQAAAWRADRLRGPS